MNTQLQAEQATPRFAGQGRQRREDLIPSVYKSQYSKCSISYQKKIIKHAKKQESINQFTREKK